MENTPPTVVFSEEPSLDLGDLPDAPDPMDLYEYPDDHVYIVHEDIEDYLFYLTEGYWPERPLAGWCYKDLPEDH